MDVMISSTFNFISPKGSKNNIKIKASYWEYLQMPLSSKHTILKVTIKVTRFLWMNNWTLRGNKYVVLSEMFVPTDIHLNNLIINNNNNDNNDNNMDTYSEWINRLNTQNRSILIFKYFFNNIYVCK